MQRTAVNSGVAVVARAAVEVSSLAHPHPAPRRSTAELAGSGANPIFDINARNALGVAPMPGDDRGSLADSDRADEEVSVGQPLPLTLKERLGLAEDLHRGFIESENGQRPEELRDETTVLHWRDRLGCSVEELGGCDPRRRHVI